VLTYLHKVLWNWAGILLSIDAGIALLERYLGDFIERQLHRKLVVPTFAKVGFAVLVLLVAQGVAYQDAQRSIARGARDNDSLRSKIDALTSEIDTQKLDIDRLNKTSFNNKKPMIAPAVDKAGQIDRLLNTEQKEHLYQDLKRIAVDPRQKDFITVTIAAAYPHDRESSRLVLQLFGVFQDAGWTVISQQAPNYEQGIQGQIPIGIWVSATNNMALFVESGLINSGLNAEVHPITLQQGFKGVLILVGYKAGTI
jgi:hypothetical protein